MGGGLDSRCVGRVCGVDVQIKLFHEEDARSNNPQLSFYIGSYRHISIISLLLYSKLPAQQKFPVM